MILGIDALIATLSLAIAALLRFEGTVIRDERDLLLIALPLLIAARLLANLFFRLDRWSFRFSGLPDGARIAMAGLFGTGLWVLGLVLIDLRNLSRAVVVIELLLSTIAMAMVRFMPRLLWMYRADLLRSRRPAAIRTLIVGAGATGEMVLRDLQRSTDHDYHVLGFVDDDPKLWGDVVGGRSVLGGVTDIPNLAARFGVELVLIAIPKLVASRVREILSLCSSCKLRFKILPGSYRHLAATASMLHDLEPGDLLERDEVTFQHDDPASCFGLERRQLVAGAAGSIGSEVSTQLLAMGCRRLVMLDIDENGLYMLKRRFERRFPDRQIVAEVADLRDVSRIRALFALHRPTDVFHAAACKQVPLMERCPGEAVKTNVLGTRILARAAHEQAAHRFVFMSTDKAVRPSSVMGATKRLGEMIVRSMDARSETRFSVVRFGNVLDSAGSVVPVFREQIQNGGPVTVSHAEARRFFMTISEAVGLVLKAAYGDYGELCVLEMGDQIRILDLARHMITMAGHVPDVDVKIEITGLRPGEKVEEELLAEDESVVRRVDRKVSVVASTPPPENLDRLVDEIALAAASEDAEAVVRLLRQAVPDFRSPAAVSLTDDDSQIAVVLPG